MYAALERFGTHIYDVSEWGLPANSTVLARQKEARRAARAYADAVVTEASRRVRAVFPGAAYVDLAASGDVVGILAAAGPPPEVLWSGMKRMLGSLYLAERPDSPEGWSTQERKVVGRMICAAASTRYRLDIEQESVWLTSGGRPDTELLRVPLRPVRKKTAKKATAEESVTS